MSLHGGRRLVGSAVSPDQSANHSRTERQSTFGRTETIRVELLGDPGRTSLLVVQLEDAILQLLIVQASFVRRTSSLPCSRGNLYGEQNLPTSFILQAPNLPRPHNHTLHISTVMESSPLPGVRVSPHTAQAFQNLVWNLVWGRIFTLESISLLIW